MEMRHKLSRPHPPAGSPPPRPWPAPESSSEGEREREELALICWLTTLVTLALIGAPPEVAL